jgi:SNF2 family DNA or RNA helicase
LESVESGIPWLFYSADKREIVRDSYTEIKAAVEGEYAREINRLTDVLLASSRAPSDKVVWNDFQKNNIEYISVLEEIVPGALGNDDILYGLPEELAREIQEEVFFPDGLLCTLRRYQEWGVKYILHQKKVLLGDEMGLGKTVQAIATMVSLRNTGATHFIVVCPASVVTNWCREVVKHSKLRVTKIHGTGRANALKSWVKTGGVAVTTFETTAYIRDESIERIDLLIVDEAHYIKNPEARRSINVKRLCGKATRLLFMTGTALENKVEEMVSLIEVLQPSIASSVQNMTFMPSAPQFRNRVAPVYYRRKREDVLTELPELIETKEWCTLNAGEKEIYEKNVLNKNYAASRRLSWDADDIKKSCKAIRLLEIIEEAKSEDRKVLVFSFFLDTIRTIGDLLGARCYGPINGSVPPPRRQEIIDAFDKAPAGSVLLAQIQSGGTGLNIQSASVVVICEPQFKPSIENQAISRAYRMGQARNVLVYRLLCINTIDEKITELLEYKQEIFDAFADKSVAAEQNESHIVEVDEKKFGQLIQEEIDRINSEKGNVPQSDGESNSLVVES